MKTLILLFAFLVLCPTCFSFQGQRLGSVTIALQTLQGSCRSREHGSALYMAQVSEQEAKKGIDKVVQALRRDSTANEELGKLEQVTVVLGYGIPTPGSLAVRFNASFKKGGFGRSSVPLPFGLGQSNKAEGRGKMVGQVKAAIDTKTGKVTSCSVFRDLGYGRAFNLKC